MDPVYPYQGCSEVTAKFVAQFYLMSETFIYTVYHPPILTIFYLFIVYSYYHQISLLKKKKKNNLAYSMYFQEPRHFYFCEARWDVEGKMRGREGRRKPIQGPHFLMFTKVLSGNCCSISWKRSPSIMQTLRFLFSLGDLQIPQCMVLIPLCYNAFALTACPANFLAKTSQLQTVPVRDLW